MKIAWALLSLALGLSAAAAAVAAPPDGKAIFESHCSKCHDKGVGRAPPRETLAQFAPERVVAALMGGIMSQQGWNLTNTEAKAVASFLTGKPFGSEELPKSAYCTVAPASFTKPFSKPYWNGWGVDPANHRMQSAAMAGLTADQVPKLKLKWAFAIPGVVRVYGQPTVVDGRIFVGTAADKVYSLDAKSGCIYWAMDADAGVRSAITIAPQGAQWAAYFTDLRGSVYSVDAMTGKLNWKVRAEDNPFAFATGDPAYFEGRLYVTISSREEEMASDPEYACCKFRGSISAFDAKSGKRIWKTYSIAEEPHPVGKDKEGRNLIGPAGAGVWVSPTIDAKARAIYVGTGNQYSGPAVNTSDALMALDMDTGKVRWTHQMTEGDVMFRPCATRQECDNQPTPPDFDFGAAPVLVDLPNGKRALIAGQKSGVVHAVDPDRNGEILWQTPIGKGGFEGGVEHGIAVDQNNVYAALSDFRMKLGKKSDPNARPTIVGIYSIPDKDAGGGLYALDIVTGKQTWYAPPPGCGDKTDCSPAQSAAVTATPGVVFSGSLDGHIRAYSTANGKILWDVDTVREYQGVNGIKGNGGSIDGPGPVVVGGMVYINSGYGLVGGKPGNMLLAFSISDE